MACHTCEKWNSGGENKWVGEKMKRGLSATQFKGSGKTQGDWEPTHSCRMPAPKFRLPPKSPLSAALGKELAEIKNRGTKISSVGRVWLGIKARCTNTGQAVRRIQSHSGSQGAFPKHTAPLFSPCPPESGYLGWNLSLGMAPDPTARYHFLNKKDPRASHAQSSCTFTYR